MDKVFIKNDKNKLQIMAQKLNFQENIEPQLKQKFSLNYDDAICTIKKTPYGDIDLYISENILYFHDTQKSVKNGLLWIRKNLL
jgi:hypothetical protein